MICTSLFPAIFRDHDKRTLRLVKVGCYCCWAVDCSYKVLSCYL